MKGFGLLATALCLALVLGAPCDARCASRLLLSKSIPHYAREMEFYYQKPRPEIIPELLKSMRDGGVLAQNEKSLMLAAFLAALALEKRLELSALVPLAASLGPDAAKTIAWSAHLAGCPNGNAVIENLLGENRLLTRQIEESPAPLAKWSPLSEPAALQMYWMAFFATGKNEWLDAIIRAALEYGRLRSQGRWREHDYQVGKIAASSLFEFARTHERVRKRLQEFLRSAKNGHETGLLRQILQD